MCTEPDQTRSPAKRCHVETTVTRCLQVRHCATKEYPIHKSTHQQTSFNVKIIAITLSLPGSGAGCCGNMIVNQAPGRRQFSYQRKISDLYPMLPHGHISQEQTVRFYANDLPWQPWKESKTSNLAQQSHPADLERIATSEIPAQPILGFQITPQIPEAISSRFKAVQCQQLISKITHFCQTFLSKSTVVSIESFSTWRFSDPKKF